MAKGKHTTDYRYLKTEVSRFMLESTEQSVLNFKREYEEHFQPVEKESWASYWEKMTRDGEWADYLFVKGTAWFLEHDIHIVLTSATEQNPFITIKGNLQCEEHPSSGIDLILGSNNNKHYQSLLPLSAETNYQQLFSPVSVMNLMVQKENSSHKQSQEFSEKRIPQQYQEDMSTIAKRKESVFEYDTLRFEISEQGQYICFFCGQPQTRLMLHLERKCVHTLSNLEHFRKSFNTYRLWRNRLSLENKKKTINKEEYLENQRKRKAKTDSKQKKDDKESFCQNKRKRQAKTDSKQKKDDKESFQINQRKRRAKTDCKQKKDDDESFRINQRKR